MKSLQFMSITPCEHLLAGLCAIQSTLAKSASRSSVDKFTNTNFVIGTVALDHLAFIASVKFIPSSGFKSPLMRRQILLYFHSPDCHRSFSPLYSLNRIHARTSCFAAGPTWESCLFE